MLSGVRIVTVLLSAPAPGAGQGASSLPARQRKVAALDAQPVPTKRTLSRLMLALHVVTVSVPPDGRPGGRRRTSAALPYPNTGESKPTPEAQVPDEKAPSPPIAASCAVSVTTAKPDVPLTSALSGGHTGERVALGVGGAEGDAFGVRGGRGVSRGAEDALGDTLCEGSAVTLGDRCEEHNAARSARLVTRMCQTPRIARAEGEDGSAEGQPPPGPFHHRPAGVCEGPKRQGGSRTHLRLARAAWRSCYSPACHRARRPSRTWL